MDLLIFIHIALSLTLINTIALLVILFNARNFQAPAIKTFILIIFVLTLIFIEDFTTNNWYYHLFINYHGIIFPLRQIAFLVGPLVLFYTKRCTVKKQEKVKISLLHYLTFVFALLMAIYYAVSSKNFNMWYLPLTLPLTIIGKTSVIIYLFASIYVLKNNGFYFPVLSKQTQTFSNSFIAPFLLFMLTYWAIKLFISLILINYTGTDIYIEVWSYFILHVGIAISISMLLYYLIRNMDFLHTTNKTTASYIENIDNSSYLTQLNHYLDTKKVYKNPEITLSLLSKDLELNPRYLSTIINSTFNVGFIELINNYRIEESKKLLINETNLTIQEIMYDVGFSSKSVFYTHFKKIMGITPKQFREQFKISKN